MRNILIGIVIGFIVGGGTAFAYSRRISLQDGNGVELGTTANPLYIQNVD